jgi:hypothetical protein
MESGSQCGPRIYINTVVGTIVGVVYLTLGINGVGMVVL